MFGFFDFKDKWHIHFAVIVILVLSVLSWVQFVREIGMIAVNDNAGNKEADVSSSESGRKSADSGQDGSEAASEPVFTDRCAVCNAADTVIDKLDSVWTVFGKENLSRVDSVASYYLTKDIFSVQVVAGTDKWLFYNSGAEEANPMADYEGTNMFTREESEEVLRAASARQAYAEERGVRYAILVAPDKENIYNEYVPEIYRHAEKSATDNLVDYLTEKGVNIISPKEELMEEKNNSQIYYRYDTHWNQLGAYIGVRKALLSWDVTIPDLSDRSFKTKALKDNYHYCGEDDLAKMAGLRQVLSDETEYEIDGTIPMDWKSFEKEQKAGEISCFHNEEAVYGSSILLVGDSYRSSMIPSLREQFADVYVIHRQFYYPDIIDEISPDYYLEEYVERYSRDILQVISK